MPMAMRWRRSAAKGQRPSWTNTRNIWNRRTCRPCHGPADADAGGLPRQELGADLLFRQIRAGPGALAFGLFHTLLLQAQQGDLPMKTMILYTILPGAIGYYAPQYWVQRRLQTRQAQIILGFADALDLMLVCVDAGQSLDQCINRVAKEMKVGYKALAEEFEIVAQEVKAGKERVVVLKDMSERIGVPDVSFITTLIQSATFGTSISDALRVYVAEMRDKRVMRAEEKGEHLAHQAFLGTMVYLPPLMVMLVGPRSTVSPLG